MLRIFSLNFWEEMNYSKVPLEDSTVHYMHPELLFMGIEKLSVQQERMHTSHSGFNINSEKTFVECGSY